MSALGSQGSLGDGPFAVISGFVSLLLSVLPLALDTFAIAAVVGASRPCGWTRGRVSAIFVLFEGGMPLLGFAVGTSLGQAIGSVADYLSGGLLIALAGYLQWADDDDDDDGPEGEVAKARRLITARGLAVLGLGLSISLDELAIGFGLGLGSHREAALTHVATIVSVIVIQTLVVSQLGLSLGRWISPHLRERIEQFTSPGLAILGGYLLTGQLIQTRLLTALDTALLSAVMLIPAGVSIYYARRSTPPASSPQTDSGPAVIASNPEPVTPDPMTPGQLGSGRHRLHHPRTGHPHPVRTAVS